LVVVVWLESRMMMRVLYRQAIMFF
jgi:hypothetical protein